MPTSSITEKAGDGRGVIRLCTTHLESLGSGAALRKQQLRLVSKQLQDCKDGEDVVSCRVVGGNFSSIEDHKDSKPTETGLTDVWTRASMLSSGDLQTINCPG